MRFFLKRFPAKPISTDISSSKQTKKYIKLVLLGGGVAAGAYYWPEISFFGQAVNRVCHTASAVALLAMDYKWTLGSYLKVQELRKLLPEEEREYEALKSEVHLRAAKRLLTLFQRNGGVYIKLGQHLSALDFILPNEYCRTLSVLQNEAPASPPEDICLVFLEELGYEFPHLKHKDAVQRGKAIMESVFRRFDWRPIGAASLAQVHVAERHDGERVAVKIQHRRVLGFATLDMATASVAVKWIKRVFPNFEFSWIAEEIKANLPRELNFLQEGHNAERLAKYQDIQNPAVIVPTIHWDLSTPRILVMEFVTGEKINHITHRIDLRRLSERLTRAYSEMIFVHGFVHCDPHPGNILVRKNPQAADGFDLVLLDHGLYKELSDDFRVEYARLWKAVVDCDEPAIAHACEYFGNGTAHRLFSSILTHRSWDRLGSMRNLAASTHSHAELERIREKAPLYLEKIAHLLAALPRDMLLLLKTNDLLRNIDRQLLSQEQVPSRSFLIMAWYCALAIEREEEKRMSIWRARFRFYRAVFKYRLMGWILKFASYFTSFRE